MRRFSVLHSAALRLHSVSLRLHSVSLRLLGGFAVLLLLQVAVAVMVITQGQKLDDAMSSDLAVEAKLRQVRTAATRLTDTQAHLSNYLRAGAASDRNAAEGALADLAGSVDQVMARGGNAELGVAGAALTRALTELVAAATAQRMAVGALQASIKQVQNALAALAEAAPRAPDRSTVEALAAAVGAALRPVSAVAAFLVSERPEDADNFHAGMVELRSALQTAMAVDADPSARLQRLLGAVTLRLNGLDATLAALETAGGARNASMGRMTAVVGQARVVIAATLERAGAEQTASQDEMLLASGRVRRTFASCIAVSGVLGAVFAIAVSLSITRPLRRLADTMRRLAEGALGIAVPDRARRDEIGGMAKAVQVFKETMNRNVELAAEQARIKAEAADERRVTLHRLADVFEAHVGDTVAVLATGSSELEATARSMTGTAAQTDRQASAGALAAGQASVGVQTVAAAAAQLAASITEINGQMERSAATTAAVVALARRTGEVVRGLAEGAQTIGKVTGLIATISGKTNLLALNATIEAARAGDAGRGFAVVASEVKMLADQTARAAERITAEVGRNAAMVRDAVEAINEITGAIETASAIAAAIAAAVLEQGAATAEISRNVRGTAVATADVTVTIGGVKAAASVTGEAAGRVLAAARDASVMAQRLAVQVRGFAADVRAA